MNYLGDFPAGATVYVPFQTFNAAGASVTLTGLAVTDIEIYKDGSTTQRASDAGYTLLDTDGIDFDGITGIHGFKIDLSDNTDAGFFAAGHEYMVIVATVTVDSQTVNFVGATFSIERAGLNTQAKADVNFQIVDALTVDVIADSTPAHETRPTIAQAVLLITRLLMEKSVSSTTVTVKKEDGSTSALTLTLDDATNPTSITRTA